MTSRSAAATCWSAPANWSSRTSTASWSSPAPSRPRSSRLAAEKVGKENATRRELLKGRSLREVFDEFGVL